jgi:hypothetical protein
MASKIPRWLLGCGIGCLAVLVLGLALTGFGTVWVWNMVERFDRTIETRVEVEERFDRPETFTPADGGVVPPDRLARFLEVRRALEPLCPRFDATIGRIEEFDEHAGDEPPALGDMFGVLKDVMGFPRLLADHMEARNQALLEAELGFGEYTYIYIVAYAAGPTARARDLPVQRILSRRVRAAFVSMLERGRDRLKDDPARAETAAVFQAEIEALRDDTDRWPWQDGLPAAIADSLQPRVGELAQLECPNEAEFALGRATRQGISIRGD